MRDLISLAVRYSRDRTSTFFGLLGGSGRVDFLRLFETGVFAPALLLPVVFLADTFLAPSSAVFLDEVFDLTAGPGADFLESDFALFEVFLGMSAENDHWGSEKSIAEMSKRSRNDEHSPPKTLVLRESGNTVNFNFYS